MNLIKKQHNSYPTTTIWDELFGKDWIDMNGGQSVNFNMPAVNIKNNKDSVDLELAAPGMKKDDFKIEVDNDLLTISSEIKHESETTEGEYTRKEFGVQSFKRSFTIPKWVEADKIEASYKEGVLNISIPKREEAIEKPARLINIS